MAIYTLRPRLLFFLFAPALLGGCSDSPCGWIYPRAEELIGGEKGKGEPFFLPRLGVLISASQLPRRGVCTSLAPERLSLLVNLSPHPFRLLEFYRMRFFVPLKPYPSGSILEVRWNDCENSCTILRIPVEASPLTTSLVPLPPFRFQERIPAGEIPRRLHQFRFTGEKRIGVDPELNVEKVDLWIFEGEGEEGDPVPLYLLVPTDEVSQQKPLLPVIYFHGFRSCKETVFAFADIAARLGIVLFAFDLKGHGERALTTIPYECGATLPWELLLAGGLPAFSSAIREAARLSLRLVMQIVEGDLSGLYPTLLKKVSGYGVGILAHSLGGEVSFVLMGAKVPFVRAYAFTASGIGYAGMLPHFLDPQESRFLVHLLPTPWIGKAAHVLGSYEPAREISTLSPNIYLFAQIMSRDQVLPPIVYETLVHTLDLKEDLGRGVAAGYRFYDVIPRGHLGIFFPDKGLEQRLLQWQIFQFFRRALTQSEGEPIVIFPWNFPDAISSVAEIYEQNPLP